MKAQINKQARNTKPRLKEQGDIKVDALNSIILNKRGLPDYLAIDLYTEIRSWYKPKKTVLHGNVIYSSKLKGRGFQATYKYFADKHKRSKDLIRTKFVLLEKLGLITREFTDEDFYGKRFNNVMRILVWKDTPHFYSDIGLEKEEQIATQNTHTPIHKNKDSLSENSSTPLLETKETIYRKPNNKVEEDRAITSSKSSSLLNVEYDCTVVARDNTLQQETLPHTEPYEERALDTECRSLSVPYGAAPCLSEHRPELTLTHEQEKKHYSKHNGRESSSNQPISLLQVLATMQDIPIAANQNNETNLRPNEQQEEDIPSPAIMNQDTRTKEEAVVNTDKPIQLRQEIFKSFNPRTSEGIMENCTFTELEPNKLGISIQAEFSLNQEDKDKLKTCIRAVYGDDVKMVSAPSQNKQEVPQTQTKETPIRYVKTEWDGMKEKIAKYFPENQYNHVIGTWLDHLNCSYSNEEKVVVIGRAFYVDYIADKFASAIEQAVAQTRKSLVLQYEGNAQRPIEFNYQKLNKR